MTRLASARDIDLARPITFTFDRRTLQAFVGDTIASALIANGLDIVGRSFKYHRPRGLYAAWVEEPNGLVEVDGEPNTRATTTFVRMGMRVRSQNAAPSLRHDAYGALDLFNRFLPAGFYYKTFMWPSWRFYEPAIRELAGMGRISVEPSSSRCSKRNAHCDVLVVGGGAAGLSAALSASAGGADVLLVDDRASPGGALAWREAEIDGAPAANFVRDSVARLRGRPNVRILTSTQAFAAYVDNYFALIEDRVVEGGPVDRRIWRVRAKSVVLAAGAIERPLVFPYNDRPGVMLASAAVEYARRFGVIVGRRPVIFTNNNDGWSAADTLVQLGVAPVAVIDVRERVDSSLQASLCAAGVPIRLGATVTDTRGRNRIRSVRVDSHDGGDRQTFACDALLVAGGWTPTAHLYSQLGHRLAYDAEQACFRPHRPVHGLSVVGGADGCFSIAEALSQGWAAGCDAAGLAADDPARREGSSSSEASSKLELQPYWRTPKALAGYARQWVDLQNDVTSKDVELAAREGFHSVEHVKRYTTSGMANDQGKTSNVNALAILGEALGQSPDETGVTTFRPPYNPVPLQAFAGFERGELYRPYRYLAAHGAHVEANAVFIEAAQWLRPDYYPRDGETKEAAASREIDAVRTAVGVFDASPLGKLRVSGPDAAKFLEHVYINAVSSLKPTRIRYGVMTNEHGVVVDDGVFLREGEDAFVLSPSSGMVGRVSDSLTEWLQCEWREWDVVLQNVTSQFSTVAIAGPRAREVLGELGTGLDLSAASFPHMSFKDAGASMRVARVSFTGEVQFEVSVAAGHGERLWRSALAAATAAGGCAVGAEAWLQLRLDKGYIHVGTDTDGTTVPDDIGFTHWRKKPVDFVGRRSLTRTAALAEDRLQLVGLKPLQGAVLLPVGAQVMGADKGGANRSAGRVTSSRISAELGPIAIGLVEGGRRRMGEVVDLVSHSGRFKAEITSTQFYDPTGTRLNA